MSFNPRLDHEVNVTSTTFSADYRGMIKCDCTSNAITVTLPDATVNSGARYVIKKSDSSVNAVTVATISSQTIDGSLTKSLSSQYSEIEVFCDGANWQIISTYPVATSVSPNHTQDFRLTLTSGNPVTSTNVLGATSIYFTPYRGNSISLYDGTSTWTTYTSSELSIAIPSSAHRIYDVFAYNNSGTPALELNAWDSGGQITGTITGATAANPCVLTSSNSLSIGDFIFVDGIVGTLGTDSVQGLNGKCCRISSVSSTTITLEGMDTSGLTYTSGGTFYKVPQSRTDALVYQNGIYVKTGATTRRYIGSFITTVAGQTEDSTSRRLVFTYQSNLNRNLYANDTTANWTFVGNGAYRPSNANTTAGVGRCEFIIGVSQNICRVFNKSYCTSSGGVNNLTGVGLDSNVSWATNEVAGEMGSSSSVSLYSDLLFLPTSGYHFIQRIERCQGTGQFFGANSNYDLPGMTGAVVQ